MGLRRSLYCGRQKVRVVEPNGQIRHFHFPITVPDLLRLYPHHFLRHISGSNLDPDAELEGGDTYMLFPLPRLFPAKGPTLLPTAKRPPESNPRLPPSAETQSRKRKTWRRRRYWEPSLDMIEENAMLLQTKEEEDRIHRQTVKYKAQNSAFRKEPWLVQRRLNVSAGFILSPIF